MPVFDTSNVIDNSIYLKAKLKTNKVSDNYYIQNLQYKRDKDWLMRYNVVNIEEELNKQVNYTIESPNYTPIDVVIRQVKSETGVDLGSDWADIAFRDLQHYNNIGSRYRFSTEFPNMEQMTEEEKKYETSIWITVNKNPVSAGNNCVLRRCNSSIAFVGSPELDYNDITEIHYEPIILENDLKYISMYYNMTTVIPQSEWYATMQLNYFSNCITINDRVIFGGVNLDDKQNNAVYKVKAVVKASALNTFSKKGSTEIEKIPLCIVAFDKDEINETGDDFINKVAQQAPIYLTKEILPVYKYYFILNDYNEEDNTNQIIDTYTDKILLGQEQEYITKLILNDNIQQVDTYEITAQLYEYKEDEDLNSSTYGETIAIPIDNQEEYYEFVIDTDKSQQGNIFIIKNLKAFNFGSINITVKAQDPQNDTNYITQNFYIKLGGFY